jgi:hypothetical protein
MGQVVEEVLVIEKVSSMVPAAPDDPELAMDNCVARQAPVAAAVDEVVEVVLEVEVEVELAPDVAVVVVVEVLVLGGEADGLPQAATRSPAAPSATTTPTVRIHEPGGRRVSRGRGFCVMKGTLLPVSRRSRGRPW